MEKCQGFEYSLERNSYGNTEGYVPCPRPAAKSMLVTSKATGLQWLVRACEEHAIAK